MRFAISLMALLSCSTVLGMPIQIFYESHPQRAQWIKNIFTEDYSIPADLIGMKEVERCEDLGKKGKLDLCLKNNGDLLEVSVDRRFITESLKIFKSP
jgi:hypothetical protein